MKMQSFNTLVVLVALAVFSSGCSSMKTSGAEIDRQADAALKTLRTQVDGAQLFLDQSQGYLVFPRIVRAGLGVGGETGEGVLRVGGKTVEYVRISGGSIGLQAGAQARSTVIVFMTERALKQFRDSSGWQVGVDGSVAIIDVGAGRALDTQNVRDPVVGFIFGSTGLMANLTFNGSRITKIDR